jgi:branched-chain amino acid transport system permease protein
VTAATTTDQAVPRSFAAWKQVLLVGVLFGGGALYVTLVGIVGTFEDRDIIEDVVTLGQAILLLTAILAGYFGAVRAPEGPVNRILGAAIAGFMAGAALSLLILIGPAMGLREYLPNASPQLYDLIAGVEILGIEQSWKGDSFPATFWFPAVIGIGLGTLGGLLLLLPRRIRALIILSAGGLIIMGLFAGILRGPMIQNGETAVLARQLFASNGLRLAGAIAVLGLVVLAYIVHVLFKPAERLKAIPAEKKRHPAVVLPLSALLLLIVLLLPIGFTGFIPSVIALIALYALMGLGLNITLGMAGLLDLGFVAFFAVGAYTVGLLTSTGEFGIAQWSFWVAIPFAMLTAMGFGIILGLPILHIRGDYLAIATLGFGEIIAVLARSEVLKGFIGGPRGILNIPKPFDVPPDHFLSGPNQIYYISLILATIIAFVAYRLAESRLGRAWVAMREDEDVAEALGINLVQTKTLAYMLGAAFAGLGGAVFAALFGSIISSSINLNVSILIVTVVVIGGLGSIPGAVVGAIVIIGLPELFREFAEYRFLLYGIALILVMRWRPEGLLPSRVGRQEMQQDDEDADAKPSNDEPAGTGGSEPAPASDAAGGA